MTVPGESIGSAPWRAEDISVPWLNEVLGKHGDFQGAKISSFDMDMIGGGEFGIIREVWRVKLNYEDRTSSTPESVAVKFANRDPQRRSLFAEFTAREVNAYRQIGSDSEFIMPRCYFSDSDPETGDIAILMEDLGRGRLEDSGGFSEGDAEAVVKAIAVFHAKWWGRTDLEQARWLPRPIDRAAIQKERFMPNAQKFLEKYGEQVDDEVREVISLYSEKLIPVLEAAGSPPLTLIHGDLHAANIFFDTEFRGCPVTAIDWASMARGKGATDISNLAVMGLTVNLRRAIEDRLMRLYHNTLVSEGVAGYSIDQCQADYRSRFLHQFNITVVILGYMDLSDERGRNLASTFIKRTSAAVRDHDLVGLLRAM